jgi:cyclohexadienyl dehydratase
LSFPGIFACRPDESLTVNLPVYIHRRFAAALLLLIGVAAYSAADGATNVTAPQFADPVDDTVAVLELIDARLALMGEVAAWKHREQRPVTDPTREAQVIDSMVTQAKALGLEAGAVRELFSLQMTWAREIQTQRIEMWGRDGFPATRTVQTLNELRPQLDVIGTQMLKALYLAAPDFAHTLDHSRATAVRERITARLSAGNVAASNLDNALRAVLLQFKAPAAGQLRVIRALKVLRIGTTGDYAPFSLESTGSLRGIDIELAINLAQQLGVEPRFVRTSWPTLMRDLQAGRFDIAASGISITPDRAAVASFSPAYHRDGKTPIARCSQRERYASLSAIDQPNVRVVVNPGGTNERFARERLTRAQVRVYEDNKSIFDEIVAGRADVMITDGIEVDLQTRRHTSLCRTNEATFTQADKAMLLPAHADLTVFAGTWLRTEIERGTVRAVLQKNLAAAPMR